MNRYLDALTATLLVGAGILTGLVILAALALAVHWGWQQTRYTRGAWAIRRRLARRNRPTPWP